MGDADFGAEEELRQVRDQGDCEQDGRTVAADGECEEDAADGDGEEADAEHRHLRRALADEGGKGLDLGGRGATGMAGHGVEAEGLGTDGSDRELGSFILHVFYPAMTMATAWAWDVLRRVNEARAAEGRLAVARERLRFAADLHDIQGHTLQVIALKAQLAERLLPDPGPDPNPDPNPDAGPDPAAAPDPARVAAARAQIAEVRGLAADALAETRELVQGYRAPELDEELANARDVLAAAGFTCRLDADHLPADPGTRDVFGRVLREATTNVLRHAAPGPVDVTVAEGADAWTLRVGNAVAGAGASESAPADGSGLAGLRERLDAAGGALAVLSDAPSGRFTVAAAMPRTIPTVQEVPR